mmetsp:Transcript_4062/g.10032  ORF Transcript_4062/g.10032 Transcript_4062/m.10032 type:complete len:163 (-) Transcript_4062:215-703(-)
MGGGQYWWVRWLTRYFRHIAAQGVDHASVAAAVSPPGDGEEQEDVKPNDHAMRSIAYLRRLDDDGWLWPSSAKRRTVIVVVDKHLSCDCINKVKRLLKYNGSKRLELCDGWSELIVIEDRNNCLQECSRCPTVIYCSIECQVQHYRHGCSPKQGRLSRYYRT